MRRRRLQLRRRQRIRPLMSRPMTGARVVTPAETGGTKV